MSGRTPAVFVVVLVELVVVLPRMSELLEPLLIVELVAGLPVPEVTVGSVADGFAALLIAPGFTTD